MDGFEEFSRLNVLVFGDVMLDRYWWGSVDRISPEAPVPVVRLNKTTVTAGGAANVAANVSALGASVMLFGAIGNDEGGAMFPDILAKSGISDDHLIKLNDRPTTVKTRVVAHSQQIVRLDQESEGEFNAAEESIVQERLESKLAEADIIVISDYAKGVLTNDLLKFVIDFGKTNDIKILVDPKGKDYQKYRGATLLTPNRKEAAEACKLEENGQRVVEIAGEQLLREVETDAILITQGEDGVTLFQDGVAPLHIEALPRDVYDVTGAGDTFIATVAVALGSGKTLEESARLANIAAGIVIEQIGTTVINRTELIDSAHRTEP